MTTVNCVKKNELMKINKMIYHHWKVMKKKQKKEKIKNINSKQTRLPVVKAQIKAGNNSYKLKN